MIHTATIIAIGVVLGVAVAGAIELLIDRLVDRSIARERAELARHQALPPPGPPAGAGRPPEAWTGETIRLNPADIVRPLPRDLHYRGHTLRIVVWRRRRHP